MWERKMAENRSFFLIRQKMMRQLDKIIFHFETGTFAGSIHILQCEALNGTTTNRCRNSQPFTVFYRTGPK